MNLSKKWLLDYIDLNVDDKTFSDEMNALRLQGGGLCEGGCGSGFVRPQKRGVGQSGRGMRGYGVQVVTVKADVSSHEDCSAVVKAAVDTFGKWTFL